MPRQWWLVRVVGLCGVVTAAVVAQAPTSALDKATEKWVTETHKKMTLEDKVGQLLVSSLPSTYLSTDSKEFDDLVRTTRDYHMGGFHVFGGAEPAPSVLLNPTYGT